MNDKNNAAVIVTGASSGIGKACVLALLEQGRRVVAVDMTPATAQSFGADDSQVMCSVADISHAAQVDGLFLAAIGRFGSVGGLVNSAGISAPEDGRLEQLDLDTFDRVHRINLRGSLLMCRAAVAPLRANGGGSIVNMGSVAGLRGIGGAAYAISKAGVIGLTKVMSQQYAPERIRTNAICPGMTDTPLLERARLKGGLNTARPGVVPGVGDAAGVAALAAFLLSESAGYVSGSIYTMDGGLTTH